MPSPLTFAKLELSQNRAEKFRTYMVSWGMSLTWLSHETGISLSLLSMIMNKKRTLTQKNFEKICAALNHDLDAD